MSYFSLYLDYFYPKGGVGKLSEALKNKIIKCGGEIKTEKKIIEVEIDKGSPHAHKYVFHGESDEAPGVDPGDVIVVVDE